MAAEYCFLKPVSQISPKEVAKSKPPQNHSIRRSPCLQYLEVWLGLWLLDSSRPRKHMSVSIPRFAWSHEEGIRIWSPRRLDREEPQDPSALESDAAVPPTLNDVHYFFRKENLSSRANPPRPNGMKPGKSWNLLLGLFLAGSPTRVFENFGIQGMAL